MAASNKLSTLDVSNAISGLTMEETRDLVFRAGVQLNVLKDIAAQYDGENRKQNYVQTWLDVDPDASWDKLVAELRKINKKSLATEIESKHLSRVLVHCTVSPSHFSTSSISVSAPPVACNTSGHLETITLAPVGSLPPAPPTATPAFAGSPSAAPPTATQAPVSPLPPSPLTANPAPVGSLTHSNQAMVVFEDRVEETRDAIEHFEEEFSDLKHETQELLSEKQNEDSKFVRRFQNHLLDMPVTKRQIHIRFFTRNEDEILNAKTIQKLFAILSRYCNYSNYEIVFHIVKKFCHNELMGRMVRYRDSLTSFEKSTTVDVYLCAISAHPGGGVREGFIRMTMKINKLPSECTLYEIRVLKESIEQKAHMEPYAMYIETPEEGSVYTRLLIPWQVHFLVARVLSPNFREEHLVSEVVRKRWAIKKGYLGWELWSAFDKRDVETMSSWITAGADVDYVPYWAEDSLLMMAASCSRAEAVSLLLEAGANTDLQNGWSGDSALVMAASKGRTGVVALLLDAGANINLQNKGGNSALMVAAREGSTKVVSQLLEAGANVHLQNGDGDSALLKATKGWGTNEVVSRLVEAGANIHLQNEGGNSALIMAAMEGRTELVSLLLKAGANTHLQNKIKCPNGESALIVAAREGRTEVVSLLLKAGANIDIQNENGESALIVATRKEMTEVVSLLLDAGANPDIQNEVGDSALMVACRGWGMTKIVSVLLQAGANIHIRNKNGDTAVILATVRYNLPVLKLLVRAGADLNIQNQEGLTALMISSRSGRTHLTEALLLGNSISPDIQNPNGWSALFFAVDEGDAITTELLLKAGVNPHLRDANGLTALDVAAGVPSLLRSLGIGNRSQRTVRQLLREYMQKSSEVDKEKNSPEDSSLEAPQSLDSHASSVTRLTQSLLKLLKGSRQAAKQAFVRLETRVLRPDKMKVQQLESGVRGQEGEERVRRKSTPHPPPKHTAHEEYYSSLAPQQ